MRDRKPQAFWRERQPADGRWYLEGFILGVAAADERCLADRPRQRAIGMQRDIIDPAPLRIGRKQRHLAFFVQCDELAVIAAHHETRAIRNRAQDATAVDRDFRKLVGLVHQRDVFLDTDKGRVFADEMHRDDRHATASRRTRPATEGMDAEFFAGSNRIITR